jgi:hypothetical protein
MDLCSNEILLADNLIPEHLSGCINCCGRWSCSSSLVPIPGFFFNRQACPFIYFRKLHTENLSLLHIIPTIKIIYYGNGQDPFSRCAGYYF